MSSAEVIDKNSEGGGGGVEVDGCEQQQHQRQFSLQELDELLNDDVAMRRPTPTMTSSDRDQSIKADEAGVDENNIERVTNSALFSSSDMPTNPSPDQLPSRTSHQIASATAAPSSTVVDSYNNQNTASSPSATSSIVSNSVAEEERASWRRRVSSDSRRPSHGHPQTEDDLGGGGGGGGGNEVDELTGADGGGDNVFVMTEAGKPVYARRCDERRLVTLTGLMQALLCNIRATRMSPHQPPSAAYSPTRLVNTSSKKPPQSPQKSAQDATSSASPPDADDVTHSTASIVTLNRLFVFYQPPHLTFVAISRPRRPPTQAVGRREQSCQTSEWTSTLLHLKTKLRLMYLQLVSRVGLTTLESMMKRRRNIDLANWLGRSDCRLFGVAWDAMESRPLAHLLCAVETVFLPNQYVREVAQQTLAKACHHPQVQFAMLVTLDGRLVASVRHKREPNRLKPTDVTLLLNSARGLVSVDCDHHSYPICLPAYASSGALNVSAFRLNEVDRRLLLLVMSLYQQPGESAANAVNESAPAASAQQQPGEVSQQQQHASSSSALHLDLARIHDVHARVVDVVRQNASVAEALRTACADVDRLNRLDDVDNVDDAADNGALSRADFIYESSCGGGSGVEQKITSPSSSVTHGVNESSSSEMVDDSTRDDVDDDDVDRDASLRRLSRHGSRLAVVQPGGNCQQYSVASALGPEVTRIVWHFVYKLRSIGQYTEPRLSPPYLPVGGHRHRRMMSLVARTHAILHTTTPGNASRRPNGGDGGAAHSSGTNAATAIMDEALAVDNNSVGGASNSSSTSAGGSGGGDQRRVTHVSTDAESCLGWLRPQFEMYVVTTPTATTVDVSTAMSRLVAWVSHNTTKLFVIDDDLFN